MKPIPVTDTEIAFPGSVAHLMPEYERLHPIFKKENHWTQVFYEFFYNGNKNNIGLIPMQGVDPNMAWRHIHCILGSFETKHEHKEAVCCYLFDLWFMDAVVDFENKPGVYKSLVTNDAIIIDK